MSDHDPDRMLNTIGQVEMNVSLQKMENTQLETLELDSSALSTIGASTQHYTTSSSDSNNSLTLNGVMVSASNVITAGTPAISVVGNDHRGNPDTYENIQYVTSNAIVPLQESEEKYSDSIVAVDAVTFVEMDDGNLKAGTVGAPLDLYFGVIPSSNGTPVASTTTSSSQIKHEPLNPKAHILERVYSDYILQEQQNKQTNSTANVVDSDMVILPSTLEIDSKLLTQANVSPDFKRPIKVNSHLRHGIQLEDKHQIFQEQLEGTANGKILQNDYGGTVLLLNKPVQQRQLQIIPNADFKRHFLDTSSLEELNESITSHSSNLSPKISPIEMNKPTSMMASNYSNYRNNNEISNAITIKDDMTDNITDPLSFTNTSTSSVTTSTTTLPLVSRSGRLIRRRPEYVAYVNESNQILKDDDLLEDAQISVNVPMSHHCNNNKPEVVEDLKDALSNIPDSLELLDSEDEEEDDVDCNEQYANDGKKSLPHKKRIPKKLKTTKKNVRVVKCSKCNEQFNSQQQLNQHKLSHHGNAISPPDKQMNNNSHKSFNCELCSKTFDNQLKFFEHLKNHYEPFKKHKCEVCNGEFDSIEALQEHLAVHSREHFKCDICNKTFRKESMLEMHMKVSHLTEDDATCLITQLQQLDRPYTCMVCPKSFHNQMALDHHVQTDHTDNPPEFNCEDCYRVFKSQVKLISHR